MRTHRTATTIWNRNKLKWGARRVDIFYVILRPGKKPWRSNRGVCAFDYISIVNASSYLSRFDDDDDDDGDKNAMAPVCNVVIQLVREREKQIKFFAGCHNGLRALYVRVANLFVNKYCVVPGASRRCHAVDNGAAADAILHRCAHFFHSIISFFLSFVLCERQRCIPYCSWKRIAHDSRWQWCAGCWCYRSNTFHVSPWKLPNFELRWWWLWFWQVGFSQMALRASDA